MCEIKISFCKSSGPQIKYLHKLNRNRVEKNRLEEIDQSEEQCENKGSKSKLSIKIERVEKWKI